MTEENKSALAELAKAYAEKEKLSKALIEQADKRSFAQAPTSITSKTP